MIDLITKTLLGLCFAAVVIVVGSVVLYPLYWLTLNPVWLVVSAMAGAVAIILWVCYILGDMIIKEYPW